MNEQGMLRSDLDRAAAGTARGEALMRLATHAAVGVAAVLIAAKLAAWLLTGSVALLTSLVDSVLDLVASVLNLLAVRHALEPADREHRFGHGKAEALAGLGQGAFITGSAVFLIFEAVGRLIEPRPVVQGAVGIGVMLFSIAVTLALVLFQNRVVRRTGSVAISADTLHYKSDLLTNLGVIAALALATQLGWQLADPLIAIAIALYILRGAFGIFRESYDHLMDREFPEEMRRRISEIVLAHPDSRAMHDLRTRWSGNRAFIQFHLELDPYISLLQAHRIADEIEVKIVEAFPGAEVIIHEDPAGLEGTPTGLAAV
jgi:ferrous-iron efflux pump FieF